MRRRFKLAPEFERFVRSRIVGFLDRHGVTLPLTRLMAEAYLQGASDAIETIRQAADRDGLQLPLELSEG